MSKNILHLEEDEHIIMEVRKHWIVFFGFAFNLIMSALLPFILLVFLRFLYSGVDVSLPGNSLAFFLFLYCLWLLILWISFFIHWTKYYLDVWYVTQKRIIAVDQRSIFDRGVSNLRFDRIQDVTVDVKGFLPTLLNFGNIKVQTASEDNYDFSMTSVRDPGNVKKVIFSQHNVISDRKTRAL